MPHVPIQLIVDGEVSTHSAETCFNVSTLRATDISDKALRQSGFGWGTTKMLAFWYTRTDEFLYLDSDAIVWGDLSIKGRLQEADYLVSMTKNNEFTRLEIETWFFEIAFVEKHFPDWDWRKSSARFFCPGVFAARKNAFAIEHYLKILKLNEKYPGKFKFGDMGFHNLMVFRGADQGELLVATRDFQVIFPEHPREQLEIRFAFDENGRPVVNSGDENVLHMPDHKPLVNSEKCYSRPMTYFRLRYLEITEGITGAKALDRLRQEDADYHVLRAKFLKSEKWKKVKKLLRLHPGEWRRLIGKLKAR